MGIGGGNGGLGGDGGAGVAGFFFQESVIEKTDSIHLPNGISELRYALTVPWDQHSLRWLDFEGSASGGSYANHSTGEVGLPVFANNGPDYVKVFTFTPDNGYWIAQVTVDGQSVGTANVYIFENVKANHTISVSYEAARPTADNSGVADPGETGVGDWLRYTDHAAYMKGYDTGVFGPRDNLTRAQAAQLFYNLLIEQRVTITVHFEDVPENAWYAQAVVTLASLDIVKGVGEGRFEPERSISWAEFTAMATRFAKAVTDASTSPFADVSPSDWFFGNVVTAVSYGWIDGVGEGRFAPLANISRAEAATIVNRMLARSADRDFIDRSAQVLRFDDVKPSEWFYYQVMEAANGHDFHYDVDGYETWTELKQ